MSVADDVFEGLVKGSGKSSFCVDAQLEASERYDFDPTKVTVFVEGVEWALAHSTLSGKEKKLLRSMLPARVSLTQAQHVVTAVGTLRLSPDA